MCEYFCRVIICLRVASTTYINLDCNINVRSLLIFSFFFFFLVLISWNRWKKVEGTRMCNDPDKFANNKHLPVNEHIHIDTDRGLRFHYRIQSVSCFLFQFLINHISCSCVFNHCRLQGKRFLSRRCFSYPAFLRFLFCLPFFFTPSLLPPACPSTTLLLLFLLQSTGGYFIFPFLSDCLTFSFCSFVSSINVPFYALFPSFSAFESKQMELPPTYNGIK